MKTCSRCGAQVPPNARVCPNCGAPQPQENKSRKALIAVLISLLAVLAAVVAIIIFVVMNQSDEEAKPNTFDYTCSEYTDLMNRILGGNKLEQSKWAPNSSGYKYSEKTFLIDLDTDKDSEKVTKITVGPDDTDDGVKMAAAIIMTAEPSLTQKHALT